MLIPRQHQDPVEPGPYVAVIAGTPLPVVLSWTAYGWMRGATKIARVTHFAGPIIVEKGRKDERV